MKIVADAHIPYLKGALESFAEMHYITGADINAQDVKDADALIIRTRTKVNEQLLSGSKVKLVVTATIGYDHIDRDYLQKAGIKWLNCPGCNAGSVATFIASMIAYRMELEGFDPTGKTFGIIGCGNVGQKVKQVVEALGMKVLINDPPREAQETEGEQTFHSLDDVLTQADFITLHVPYQQDGDSPTAYLMDKSTLAKMKDGAWLINSSRGGLVQEDDLKVELQNKRIKAVLDVWENEPDIDDKLMELCTIATAHIAGYSVDGKANGTSYSVNHIANFFDLPLTHWAVKNLPKSGRVIDVAEGTEGFIQAVFNIYDIRGDNLYLKSASELFEKLRGNYAPRRDINKVIFVGDRANCLKLQSMMF
jgi:erythronate-4-phosphate dehydrogenase